MAAKQLNKRLVVGLGLFGFACMILLSVLMLRQLQRRDPKYFVQLAETAAAQEQWQQAALFYNEAWERSGEARFLVDAGEMLLREGDPGSAVRAWKQALVHQPDLLRAHERQVALLVQTAQLYATPQRWQQVSDAAEALLAAAPSDALEQRALAQHARGLALLNLESQDAGNAERGIAAITEATRLAPGNVEYAIDLARELIRQERVDQGQQVYLALIQQHTAPGGDASRARLAYAQHLAEKQRLDEAETFFHQSMDSAGGDPSALREAKIGYARFISYRWVAAVREGTSKQAADDLFAQAEKILRECIEAEPDEFEPYLQTAFLYKAAQRHADVVDICEARIRRGLSRKGVEATQNRVRMFTLMINASEACVALGVKADDVAEREKWLAKAEQYVADAKGESASHPRVLSQAGRVKLARGQDREALKELRAADEAYGTYDAVNWENKIILAQVHMRLSEAGAARDVLESVLDKAMRYRSRDPIFWNLYAQVLLANNDLDRALAICDRVLLLDSSNTDARQLKAAIHERQGKLEVAGMEHEKATGSPTIRAMLQARALGLGGEQEAAVQVLLSALEHDPADSRLVAATINELINLNRHDDAQSVAARALAVKPDDLRLQQLSLLARRDLTPQQRDEATLQLLMAEEDDLQRDLDLAMFYARKEKLAEAVQALDSAERHILAKDTPLGRSATATQHAAVLKAKIRAAAQMEDIAAMGAARDSAARHNVDGAGGKSLLGWYHLQRQEYELAVNAYRDAIAAQPTDATSLAHLAQCLQVLGRLDEAKAAYEQAVEINPNEGIAHQGLAMIAQARGDTEGFARELAICERLLPNEPWVREQVTIRTEEGDPAGAISRREARLAESPDDAWNLQRLAILYENAGDYVNAEQAHARLRELRPSDERVVMASAAFYRRTDREEEGLALVRQFAESRTDPKQRAVAALILANEQIQLRRLEDAEKTLLTAHETSPSLDVARGIAEFYVRAANQPAKAAAWYQRAVDLARREKPAVVAELLDAKIASLLNRSVNDLEQARRDTEELRNQHPDFARGFLWESEIAARNGDIDRAISKLGDYLNARPNEAYALYQRARHLVSRGKIVAAMADLEAIKRASPLALELQPRLLLARLHLRAGQRDLWIAELESLVKDAEQRRESAVAVEALANAYISEKRLADAERLVTAQINRTAESPQWYFLRGRISLALGDSERALGDFRRGAEISKFSAESVLQVLTAYFQTGRFAAGVEYYDRLPPQERPSAGMLSRYAQLLARYGAKAKAVEQFRLAMARALGEEADSPQQVGNDVFAVFTPQEAVTAFEGAPPDPALARANDRILARAVGLVGQVDDAADRYDALLAAANDHERATLLHERGDLYQTAGRTDSAVESYKEALKYDPTNWVTLNNIAYLLSDAGGANEEALPYAQKAVALADNAYTLDTLGWIYVGLSRYPLAIAELSRAIRVNPEYALPYYHLGEAYRRSSQFVEAADVLRDGANVAKAAKDEALMKQIESAIDRSAQRDATP